jgi:hypothetical protein
MIQQSLPRFINLDPFPVTMRRKFAYTQVFFLTGGTSGLTGTAQVFRMNSLYDPDLTGTGHQPYGFDQLVSSAGPYLRYKVTGLTAKITCTGPNNSAGLYVAIGVHNSGSSATLSGISLEYTAEKHNSKILFVPYSGNQTATHNLKFPTLAPFFGFTKQQFDSDTANATGGYSGNPGSVPRLELVASSPYVDSVGFTVMVQLEYDAVLYQRSQLVAS